MDRCGSPHGVARGLDSVRGLEPKCPKEFLQRGRSAEGVHAEDHAVNPMWRSQPKEASRHRATSEPELTVRVCARLQPDPVTGRAIPVAESTGGQVFRDQIPAWWPTWPTTRLVGRL